MSVMPRRRSAIAIATPEKPLPMIRMRVGRAPVVAAGIVLSIAPTFALVGLAHHLETGQRAFEFTNGAFALGVLAVQPVEHGVHRAAVAAQLREEQPGLLRMVQLFGELVDIEQQRAQRVEVGQRPVAPMFGQQQDDRAQHG